MQATIDVLILTQPRETVMWLAFGAFESAHKGVSWCMAEAVATVQRFSQQQ